MARGDGHDLLYQAIGERIAKTRRTTELSQARLAVKVGVTRASIVNIECGRQRAPLHLLWQIAIALEIEPARLVPSVRELAARDAPVQLDATVVAYIERAVQDDPAAKRLITDFIKKATTHIEGDDAEGLEAIKR